MNYAYAAITDRQIVEGWRTSTNYIGIFDCESAASPRERCDTGKLCAWTGLSETLLAQLAQ